MNAFEKILSEIDNGIKTIEPLMKGETRQIAESRVIGLEEARKIVEKYKGNTGWIPCGERLPDKVIVLCDVLYAEETDEAFHDIKILNYIGGGKFVNSWNDEQKVIAWMPLPEPYRPKEDK